MPAARRGRREPAATAAVAPALAPPDRSGPWIALGLTLLTVVVFWPALSGRFLVWDDDLYVTGNPAVLRGLTADGVRWAATTFHTGNWHPLTWLSLMADRTLWGEKTFGYHLTNLLLHAANVLLVWRVLEVATRSRWRSVLVAAAFAVHPLRVESVAWISERKDVLCACFGLLALAAYVGRRRGLLVVCFAASLLAKPMLVTLPLLLVLLDRWPLRRPLNASTLLAKLPVTLLAAVAAVVAMASQGHAGTVQTIPPAARVANALVAYVRYLGATIWPLDLAPLYPHPLHWPAWQVVGAGAVLLAISALAVLRAREWPHLALGWAWYLLLLVPVIGLVQIGVQSMADRYTYLPAIGLAIAAVWSLPEAWWQRQDTRIVTASAAAALIGTCALLTFEQAGRWKDSVTLFAHTVSVTRDNIHAEAVLGNALLADGRLDEAAERLRALPARGDFAPVRGRLGAALLAAGRPGEAIAELERVVEWLPGAAEAHGNLGAALMAQGEPARAIVHLERAAELAPGSADILFNLGRAAAELGDLPAAIAALRRVVAIAPADVEAQVSLGQALARSGQPAAAEGPLREALRLRPGHPAASALLSELRSAGG